ncbi:MAG: NAD-dependent epimerase/dehydratase family protein [Bacteroidales bacterium]|jgi:ADP-L-glycero-D-manno-heptose 6-epimerase|nr:NAD-dependent epimerase/dehydratase family protein [Bacteroidales bacterium]
MIVITGAAGFIGSHFCRKLNFHKINNTILVDDFAQENKRSNWENLAYIDTIPREQFFQWAEKNVKHIDYLFHLGARTDYYSDDNAIFELLNTEFSQRVWSFTTRNRIPLIYASSYLTNDPELPSFYAKSKYYFDKWAEKQQQTPPFWAGLKFFQVYGKNEVHKAENSSNVYKIYKKYAENVPFIDLDENIFQDYIYINDVVKVLYYFLKRTPKSGMYEIGTGFARPLQVVEAAVRKVLRVTSNELQETSNKLQVTSDKLQADLSMLRKNAYQQAFLSLEEGIKRLVISKYCFPNLQ